MYLVFRSYRGNSLLHRLNPFTKIVLLLALNGAALLTINPLYLLPLLLLSLYLFYTSGIRQTEDYRTYHTGKLILIFFLFLILFNGIFWNWETNKGGTVLFKVPAFSQAYPITLEGFYIGLGAGFRFLILLLSFLVVLSTTYPKDLSNVLEKTGIPRRISYILNISLRFVPNLESEFRRVIDARRARGDDRWERGGFKGKISMIKDIFPTILANAIVMSERVGTVLEVRKISDRASIYREYPFRREDWEVIALSIVIFILYLILSLEGMI